MNLPNLLTLSRIPLMLAVIGLLYPSPDSIWPWMRTYASLLLFFSPPSPIGSTSWLARKFGQVSEFGKFMDALSDKVLTLGMFVSLLALGELEDWALFPVLLILSREFLITGLRLVAAGKGKALAAEKIETEDDRSTYLHLSIWEKSLLWSISRKIFSGSLELHGQLVELLKTGR